MAVKAQHQDNIVPLPQPGQKAPRTARSRQPTAVQAAWLARGLDQPGGKLPLFDDDGGRIGERTIRSCLRQGWAEPWFDNPVKPDWLVCKLTGEGRRALDPNGAAESNTQIPKGNG